MRIIWPLIVWVRRHQRASIAVTAAFVLVLGIDSGCSSSDTGSTDSATPVSDPANAPARSTDPMTVGPTASPSPSAASAPSPTSTATTTLTSTASGVFEPNRMLTPGEAFPGVTAAQVCVAGYSASVRNVPAGVRRAVFAEYGIAYSLHSNYELDHLVSLELGGDNSAANLWPEPLAGSGGAKVKDQLEDKLHALVCSGQISLTEAQQAIAGDWAAADAKYAGLTVTHRTQAPAPVYSPPTPAYTQPAPPYPQPAPAGGASVYYANCTQARAAGAAPIHEGEPGYRPALDRDGDGVACE